MNLTEDEANKWDHECRAKEEKITQWACFGIVAISYCFIKDGYLLFSIPLVFSLFSVIADWISNFVFYYFYEKDKDDNKEETVLIDWYSNCSCDSYELHYKKQNEISIPGFSEFWRLVPFLLAILSFAILIIINFIFFLNMENNEEKRNLTVPEKTEERAAPGGGNTKVVKR